VTHGLKALASTSIYLRKRTLNLSSATRLRRTCAAPRGRQDRDGNRRTVSGVIVLLRPACSHLGNSRSLEPQTRLITRGNAGPPDAITERTQGRPSPAKGNTPHSMRPYDWRTY
jgi:hypothetical protein